MKLFGKVARVFELRSGVNETSGKPWAVQEFLLETDEQYPQRALMTMRTALLDRCRVAEGDEVVVTAANKVESYTNKNGEEYYRNVLEVRQVFKVEN